MLGWLLCHGGVRPGQARPGGKQTRLTTNPLLTSSPVLVEQNANVSQFPGREEGGRWQSNKLVRRYSRVTTTASPSTGEVVQLINPLGCEHSVEENPGWFVTNFMVILGRWVVKLGKYWRGTHHFILR